MSRGQITRRVASGEYRRMHPGVYLIVPFLLQHSLEMAAVLACGSGSALSHYSAAYLHKLLPHPAQPGPIHVTVPDSRTRRLRNVHVHRARLTHWDVRERQGIPVTAPTRTLLDLASCCSDEDLEVAVAEAFALNRTNRNALLKMIGPGRRGAARLRALLDAGPQRVRSTPERILLHGLRAAGIDGFLTNEPIGRWEVDFVFPAHNLAIEVDAYSTHSSPRAFRRDRRKDAELRSMGLAVQRFSADDVQEDLGGVIAWIRRALGPG